MQRTTYFQEQGLNKLSRTINEWLEGSPNISIVTMSTFRTKDRYGGANYVTALVVYEVKDEERLPF